MTCDGHGLELTRRDRPTEPGQWVSRGSGQCPNWLSCDAVPPSELGIHGAAHTRSGCANIFRLSRGGDTALARDPADDHEALNIYSPSGIVMCVRNALFSACGEDPGASAQPGGTAQRDHLTGWRASWVRRISKSGAAPAQSDHGARRPDRRILARRGADGRQSQSVSALGPNVVPVVDSARSAGMSVTAERANADIRFCAGCAGRRMTFAAAVGSTGGVGGRRRGR
jgi:hypothetical protein